MQLRLKLIREDNREKLKKIYKKLLSETNDFEVEVLRENFREELNKAYWQRTLTKKIKPIVFNKELISTVQASNKGTGGELLQKLDYLKRALNANYHALRVESRELETTIFNYTLKSGRTLTQELVAGTHTLRYPLKTPQFIDKKAKATDAKSPFNNKNHVGIELEFLSKLDDVQLENAIAKEDLEQHVQITDDGSLRPEKSYPYSHEVCIIADSDNLNCVLNKTLRVIKFYGAKVNYSCGMHVHLDMRNRDPKKAFNNLSKYQNFLFALVPPSRLEGRWAEKHETASVSEAKFLQMGNEVECDCDAFSQCDNCLEGEEPIEGEGKHFAINTIPLEDRDTLEVRIHSGTLNKRKIVNWITLLNYIVEAKKIKYPPVHIYDVIEQLDIPKYLQNYLIERLTKFTRADKPTINFIPDKLNEKHKEDEEIVKERKAINRHNELRRQYLPNALATNEL